MVASASWAGSRHRNSLRISRAVRAVRAMSVPNRPREFPLRGTKTISGTPIRTSHGIPAACSGAPDRVKADQGDAVAVRAKGERHEGILMPTRASARGCPHGEVAEAGTTSALRWATSSHRGDREHMPPRLQATSSSAIAGRPVVAVLGTGGTIASYIDYRTGAVHPP